MATFISLLGGAIKQPLLNKLTDYLEIKKGELRDKPFEKFYKTLVESFVTTQKHLDQAQARKFFASLVTYDGVLLYLYRFTDPEPLLREKITASLCRWADKFKITGGEEKTNPELVERFLQELERELRRNANKSLLPYFSDIRSDVAKAEKNIISKIEEHVKPPTQPEPEFKLTLAKLPITDHEIFGRENELALLDSAWAHEQSNVFSLVAWGGVGKSALVNSWLNDMKRDNYRGAERVYGWSFYSQGTKEERQVSADEFFNDALDWFGYKGDPILSPWDKGKKLAELVREKRGLLILDGLEPLQYPPGEMQGRLKDQGVQALLKDLARSNPGLCVISTRLQIEDLETMGNHGSERLDLENLTPEAGAQLLEKIGVQGAEKERQEAASDFDGHALALNLLGSYLKTVHKGEIRQRDLIPKLSKDRKQGGHARRVMESYEKWLKDTSELNILYLMGLFDRPAAKGAMDALRQEPAIPGLTDKLQNLEHADWQFAVQSLRDLRLLAKEDEKPDTLDCHPLVREHFGERLQQQFPDAWTEAHSRLYDYYRNLPEKELPDALEEMEPLFAAVTHGCLAGKHQEVLDDVYWERILRKDEAFVNHKLGAFGADLAALSNFFDPPWRRPAAGMVDAAKAVVLSWAGFGLRALGRLREAAAPMQAGLENTIKQENWENAAINAGNLSELFLTLGEVRQATDYARQSVDFADRSGDGFIREASRASWLADALHQSGALDEAEKLFREAEAMQQERQPDYRYLYSLQGFRFCDLLLSRGRAREVLERAKQMVKWEAQDWQSLLDRALNRLSLGRAQLLPAQDFPEQKDSLAQPENHLNQAVAGLRKAGTQDHLPHGLFVRAALYRVQAHFTKAWEDLNEAQEIAERGEMRLHLTDFHLEACRLCLAEGGGRQTEEKIRQAAAHLEQAAALVQETGYHRRDGEVAALRAEIG